MSREASAIAQLRALVAHLRRPMMPRTTNDPWARREMLRDLLLEDAFEDELIPKPARAWTGERDEDQRIVVTGMGLLTPLGIGIDAFWNGLVEGRSGVRRITLCDPGDSPCTIAGEVPEFEPRDYMEAKEARRLS